MHSNKPKCDCFRLKNALLTPIATAAHDVHYIRFGIQCPMRSHLANRCNSHFITFNVVTLFVSPTPNSNICTTAKTPHKHVISWRVHLKCQPKKKEYHSISSSTNARMAMVKLPKNVLTLCILFRTKPNAS